MLVEVLESWIQSLWSMSPAHLMIDAALIILIVTLLLRKPEPIPDPMDEISPEEEDQIIKEWKPKEFIPELPEDADKSILNAPVVTSGPTDTIEVNGKKAINFGAANFLGLNMKQEIIDEALKAVDQYAVGACGPRQFYGTMDAHLELEETTAKWLGTEDSVGYCFPFATTTSVIQAFIRNSDILFVDEGSWFAVRLGAELTRGKVIVFKHNDMADLREKVAKAKATFPRWSKCNRWAVVEGIYLNDGSVLDLPALMQIRKDFCLRTIIDETYSFGALGKTGRGVCEEFNVPRSDIEVCIGSYGPAFASLGGFTIGTKEVSAHQRLASHAYIFSASPPCFNVAAASKAVKMTQENGEQLIQQLRSNISFAHKQLSGIEGFEVLGDPRSPVIHLRPLNTENADEKLQKVVDACLESQNPVAITKSKYVRNREPNAPISSIKLFISAAHSESQISTAVSTIKSAIGTIYSP